MKTEIAISLSKFWMKEYRKESGYGHLRRNSWKLRGRGASVRYDQITVRGIVNLALEI